MQSRSRTIILKVSITCQHQLCLFVSLFIDASGNYKAEEKPPVVSYKETGSEVEKDDKPVPDASFNEGMLILFLFSLLQISTSTSMLWGKMLEFSW